jgi:hypothetical protein
MKMTVMIQYYGHVIHAGGSITYRSVEIELTEEQAKKLALKADEDYANISLAKEPPIAHGVNGN